MLIKNPFTCQCEKERERKKKVVSHFALLLVVFNGIMAVKGLNVV